MYQTTQTSQQKPQQNRKYARCYGIFYHLTPQQIIERASQLQEQERQVLDQIIFWSYIFKNIRISQGRIAKFIGIDRVIVNALIHKLCKLGLIGSIWNGVKKNCTYILNACFKTEQVKEQLGDILVWLKRGYISALSKIRSSRVITLERQGLNNSTKNECYGYRFSGGSHSFILQSESFTKDSLESLQRELLMKLCPPIIQDDIIKHVPLSVVGICKLAVIDESILVPVWKRILINKDEVENPYNALMKECMRLMEAQGKKIEWGYALELIRAVDANPTDPEVEYNGWKRSVVTQEETRVIEYENKSHEQVAQELIDESNLSIKQHEYLKILNIL